MTTLGADDDPPLNDLDSEPAAWVAQLAARGTRPGLVLWAAHAFELSRRDAARALFDPGPASPPPDPIDLDHLPRR